METGANATNAVTRRQLTRAKDLARIGELSAHTEHRALGLLRSLCERPEEEALADIEILNDDFELEACPLGDDDFCLRLVSPSLKTVTLYNVFNPIIEDILESNEDLYGALKILDEELPGISELSGLQ